MTTLNELSVKYQKLQNELKQQGKEMLSAAFQEAFEKHPDITAIYWTQYAPYFNDGEPCYFGVDDFYITNVKDLERVDFRREDIEDEEEGEFVKYLGKGYKYINDIEVFAHSSIGTDIFEDLYGDSVSVLVTPEGVTVSDYEHD